MFVSNVVCEHWILTLYILQSVSIIMPNLSNSWLRCFQFDLGVKKRTLTFYFIQIFAWYVEWKKSIHTSDLSQTLEIRKRYLRLRTHFLCGFRGDFTTWHPVPLYYTQLYLSYVKGLRRVQIYIQRNSLSNPNS